MSDVSVKMHKEIHGFLSQWLKQTSGLCSDMKKVESGSPSCHDSLEIIRSSGCPVLPSLEHGFYRQGHSMTPGGVVMPPIMESQGGATTAFPGHIHWPCLSSREPGKGDFPTGLTAQGPVTTGKDENVYLVSNQYS